MLFGFDQANRVDMHEATHGIIHALWQQLVRLHTSADPRTAESAAWPPTGFQPRQLGPSENIAAHQQH
jgi:hypothetical protein